MIENIHLKKLATAYDDLTIWLVDGKLVRDIHDVNFTEGGHHFIFPYIPAGEIWIDNDMQEAERPFVLIHEIYERGLMKTKKMAYDPAHDRASRIELKLRLDPKQTGRWLKKYSIIRK